MTIINYYETKDRKVFRLQGHAGQSIVCASISTITNMLCKGMEMLTDDDVEIYITEGTEVDVRLVLKSDDKVCNALFDIAYRAFKELSEDYPGNVLIINSALVEN